MEFYPVLPLNLSKEEVGILRGLVDDSVTYLDVKESNIINTGFPCLNATNESTS